MWRGEMLRTSIRYILPGLLVCRWDRLKMSTSCIHLGRWRMSTSYILLHWGRWRFLTRHFLPGLLVFNWGRWRVRTHYFPPDLLVCHGGSWRVARYPEHFDQTLCSLAMMNCNCSISDLTYQSQKHAVARSLRS